MGAALLAAETSQAPKNVSFLRASPNRMESSCVRNATASSGRTTLGFVSTVRLSAVPLLEQATDAATSTSLLRRRMRHMAFEFEGDHCQKTAALVID